MKQLTLLGTVHLDPMGASRLANALRTLCPDVVVCEFNEQQNKLSQVTEEVRQFKQMVAENKLDPDYELRGCRKYCEEAGVPLIDSDIRFDDDEINLLAGEATQLQQAAQMMNLTVAGLIQMMYNFSEEHVEAVCAQMPEEAKAIVMNPAREQRMEQQLRQVCSDYNRVVFVTGMMHMISLKKKLSDLRPQCQRLNFYQHQQQPHQQQPS